MARIIVTHSFHRGRGKSFITANIAALLALRGKRVGIIDASFQAPSAHVLCRLPEEQITCTFNDYLTGACDIMDAVYDVTPRLGLEQFGRFFLVPASSALMKLQQLLQTDYEVESLEQSARILSDNLALDVVLYDTNAGLNEDSLPILALSDQLLVVLHLDKQDYQGSIVITDVAKKLAIPEIFVLVNEAPSFYTRDDIQKQIEQTYDMPASGIFAYSDEINMLSSDGIFVLRYPRHPVTTTFRKLVALLLQKN